MNKCKVLYHKYMIASNKTLIQIDVFFKVCFILLILPWVNQGIKIAMHFNGISYITEENLLLFLSSPMAIILIAIFLITMPLFLLYKTITMLHYCRNVNKKLALHRLLFIGLLKTINSLTKRNFMLPLFILLMYIFTNIPLLIGITIFCQNNSPSTGAEDIIFIKGLIILFLLLAGMIAFRGIFTIYFCIHEQHSFFDSLELSKRMLKKRGWKTLRILIIYNLGLNIMFFLIYYFVLLMMALLVYAFTEKSLVISVFLSTYTKMNVLMILIFSIIAFTTNINIISSLFHIYQEEDFKDLLIEDQVRTHPKISSIHKKHRGIVMACILFVLVTGVSNFYITVKNDALYINEALSGITITAHRGNSHVAPENTLPALENAIIARSDYVEIDIQQTKDGTLILMHDFNLKRTTGINKRTWEVNLDEIRHLDAGSWFGLEFTNTPIPTLEEAIQLCKGRIKMNLEIKIHGYEKNLEENLVALIHQYELKNQCIISSMNYETLRKIKQLDQDIKTGLVITAFYGNFYDKDDFDFLSVRSIYLNKQIVEGIHKLGKEVHAWTVNSETEIERMKSIGVDCIITDHPTLTMEIVYRNDTNHTFIQLLNRMLYDRNFYKLSLPKKIRYVNQAP